MAKAMGVDPATNATIQCRLQDPLYAQALYDNVLDPLTNGSKSFVDWYWTDWGKDDNVWYRCVGDTASQPMLWSNYVSGCVWYAYVLIMSISVDRSAVVPCAAVASPME